MRILVVDDDPVSRKAVTSILAARGYDVVSASSAAEAIRLCSDDSSVHLIVMDVVLTDRDGVSAAREIRNRCDVTVLYTSGTPIAGLVAQGILHPDEIVDSRFHFLAKPFTAAAVWSAVETALRQKKQRGSMLS